MGSLFLQLIPEHRELQPQNPQSHEAKKPVSGTPKRPRGWRSFGTILSVAGLAVTGHVSLITSLFGLSAPSQTPHMLKSAPGQAGKLSRFQF